jgi:hypothetical protein
MHIEGEQTMPISVGVFVAAFALVFYVLGSTFVEGFVNYRTWTLIGANEFKAYHRAVGPRVLAVVVAPIGLLLLSTMLLLWARPAAIPRWSILLSLALVSFAMLVSVVWQIPIQLELDRVGLSLPLLRRLISFEWLRKAAHIGNALLFIWMMMRVLS